MHSSGAHALQGNTQNEHDRNAQDDCHQVAKANVSREITEAEGASANEDGLPQGDHLVVETLLAQQRTADSEDDKTRPMQQIFDPARRGSTRNETSGVGS